MQNFFKKSFSGQGSYPKNALARDHWIASSKQIRLASSSPRRLDLLRQIGIEPEVYPVDVDESRHKDEKVKHFVKRLACDKGAIALSAGADIVIAADTVVVKKGKIYGKPIHANDAKRMLKRLAGTDHKVITGVAVYRRNDRRLLTQTVVSRVWIKHLSKKEIKQYITTGEPLDKAGAYGAQGIGASLIVRLKGSYSNVVGLPLYETCEMIKTL